ncbi:MAG: divergent polysaccharide deacetylase family protein [Xanthobacteraceae bacterium]|nr:MAG: divergent polysaccharide deacetylase family protein [Xanthobacteraceae bacterium]
MTADDLSTPLKRRAVTRRIRLPFTAPQAVAGALGLFLASFAGFALFNSNPFGGEPVARIVIDRAKLPAENAKPQASPPVQASPPAQAGPAAPAGTPDQKTITIIDGSSGARRDVVIPDAGKGAAAPPASIPQQLLESSRHGAIPVIAADGLKPMQAYAAGTDADRARVAATPSISLIVAGLGLGTAKTNDALARLPGAVTLAFTPYGTELGKYVERARGSGHEVLLQVPMEPFDYPDNDPGPQTLLTSLTPAQNIDRMYWHMSRFQGYVGIASYMGARFAATEAAMAPIVREAGKRGLIYLDDGGNPRSVAGSVADAQAMTHARTDLAIDTVPTAAEIDRALSRLEALARQRGAAIGMASALPVSIERIAAWARGLESRGIVLAPLTAVAAKAKSN